MSQPGDPSLDWPQGIHQALTAAGVALVGYVPDAGHRRLIELCHDTPAMRAIPLTSEEEGVGLAGGAWLGGARTVLLMQSSGVGNLMNALGMAAECRFPLVILVTMRGEEGETNPWQFPVGRSAEALLTQMGVEVTRADAPEAVVPAVVAALDRAFGDLRDGVDGDLDRGVDRGLDREVGDRAMTAVLIAQNVIGVKHFVAEASK